MNLGNVIFVIKYIIVSEIKISHLHLYNFTDEMVTLPPEALQDQEGLLLEFNDHLEDIEDQMRRTLENAGLNLNYSDKVF